MGKSAPQQPAAPDPQKTAEAQYGFNKQAFQDVLRQGTIDQATPTGGVTYTRDVNGLPTAQNTAFSPGLGNAYNTTLDAAGSQLGLLPTTAFAPNVDGSGIRDAYVRQGISNVEDLWGRQDRERNVAYSERGIPLGSELHNTAEQEVGEGRNKYLQGITDASWQAGATEEQRKYQNALTEYGLPGTMAGNYINLGSGLLGQLPGANPLPIQNLQPGNYADTANRNYQVAASQYNQNLANQSAGMGSFLRFGGSLLGAGMPGGGSVFGTALAALSDERAKEDIAPVGELHDGQTVYRYRYKGDPQVQIGLMAQEVEETNPEAVHESGGLKFVDYGAATAPSLAMMLRGAQ